MPESYRTLNGWTEDQDLLGKAKELYNRPTETDNLPIQMMAAMVE